MNIRMSQAKPMDATTIAGLLDERSEGIEARYDSRSYRCALHIGVTCHLTRHRELVL